METIESDRTLVETQEDVMETIESDREVVAAGRRLSDLHRQRAEAVATLNRLRPGGTGGPLPYSLSYLRASEALALLDAPLAEAEREVEATTAAARRRIAEASRPARAALERRLIASVEKALGCAADLREYDAGVAAASGYAPTADPLPGLANQVATQLAILRTAIARRDRPDAPALPPRAGTVRVRITANSCWSADRTACYARGDVVDVGEAQARDLVAREIAAEVAA
jgi:hypothetical protein